jgi:hypothetical protein
MLVLPRPEVGADGRPSLVGSNAQYEGEEKGSDVERGTAMQDLIEMRRAMTNQL